MGYEVTRHSKVVPPDQYWRGNFFNYCTIREVNHIINIIIQSIGFNSLYRKVHQQQLSDMAVHSSK